MDNKNNEVVVMDVAVARLVVKTNGATKAEAKALVPDKVAAQTIADSLPVEVARYFVEAYQRKMVATQARAEAKEA